MSANYPVGYKRPPKKGQFRKGRSGNPKGRPSGSRNLKTVLSTLLQESVELSINGRPRRKTQLEAYLMVLIRAAIKGNARAWDSLLRAMQATGLLDAADDGAKPLSVSESKLLEQFAERIRRQTLAQMAKPGDATAVAPVKPKAGNGGDENGQS